MNGSKIPLVVASLALLISGLVPFSIQIGAQGEAPQFESVTMLTIRPGLEEEYEEWQKKLVAAAAKIGSTARVLVYQMAQGGPPNMFVTKTPFSRWADRDGLPNILEQAYGASEAVKIGKAGRASVESVQTEVFSLLPRLSDTLKILDSPASFLYVTRNEIKPEMESAWRSLYVARQKLAREKTPGARQFIRRASIRGQQYVHWYESSFSKYADWDAELQLDLRKFFTDVEIAQHNRARDESLIKRTQFVLRYRPELSRLGTARKSSQD